MHRVLAAIAAILVMLSLAVPASAAPVTPQEADEDMKVALQAMNTWWTKHWPEYFTGAYTSPKVTGLYDSRTQQLICGGRAMPPNNAWYCGAPDDLVAFDLVFMSQVFNQGDSFLYLIVAHEWGHAIQARLQSNLVFQAKELQADCFAGAALQGTGNDGTIVWDSSDAAEIASSLTAIGDKYPWTKVSDHGTPAERIANFNLGANGGVRACLPR